MQLYRRDTMEGLLVVADHRILASPGHTRKEFWRIFHVCHGSAQFRRKRCVRKLVAHHFNPLLVNVRSRNNSSLAAPQLRGWTNRCASRVKPDLDRLALVDGSTYPPVLSSGIRLYLQLDGGKHSKILNNLHEAKPFLYGRLRQKKCPSSGALATEGTLNLTQISRQISGQLLRSDA